MKSKNLKHKEAVERQKAHDKLSVQGKLDKAYSRRGESRKEIKRLEKKL